MNLIKFKYEPSSLVVLILRDKHYYYYYYLIFGMFLEIGVDRLWSFMCIF